MYSYVGNFIHSLMFHTWLMDFHNASVGWYAYQVIYLQYNTAPQNNTWETMNYYHNHIYMTYLPAVVDTGLVVFVSPRHFHKAMQEQTTPIPNS
jgi:hypothetical protein